MKCCLLHDLPYSFPVIVGLSKAINSKKKVLRKQYKDLLVLIATGFHLFPFRTEPLSPSAPMVLELMLRESRSVPTQINAKPCVRTDTGLSCFILIP